MSQSIRHGMRKGTGDRHRGDLHVDHPSFCELRMMTRKHPSRLLSIVGVCSSLIPPIGLVLLFAGEAFPMGGAYGPIPTRPANMAPRPIPTNILGVYTPIVPEPVSPGAYGAGVSRDRTGSVEAPVSPNEEKGPVDARKSRGGSTAQRGSIWPSPSPIAESRGDSPEDGGFAWVGIFLVLLLVAFLVRARSRE